MPARRTIGGSAVIKIPQARKPGFLAGEPLEHRPPDLLPGRTGSQSLELVLDADGSPLEVTRTPTPGAVEGRARMFAELEQAAADATRAFIGLAHGNGRQMLGIARSPAWARRALAVLDDDEDNHIAISNLVSNPWYGDDPGFVRVGRQFQAEITRIMALGAGDEDILGLPAVQIPESSTR